MRKELNSYPELKNLLIRRFAITGALVVELRCSGRKGSVFSGIKVATSGGNCKERSVVFAQIQKKSFVNQKVGAVEFIVLALFGNYTMFSYPRKPPLPTRKDCEKISLTVLAKNINLLAVKF